MRTIPTSFGRRSRARSVALVGGVALVAAALSPLRSANAVGSYDPYFASPSTAAAFASAGQRPWGVAVGDFDGDSKADIVSGRAADGRVAFSKGLGDGTFAAQSTFSTWKQTAGNASAFTAADVNSDGKLDVVWGATATSSTGCTVSPVPSTGCPGTLTVLDGEVRAYLGNGNGTFVEQAYFPSGVRHNAGVLLADVGTDAGSLTAGDVTGDGVVDLIAGANEGITLLRNTGTVGVAAFSATAIATPDVRWPSTTGNTSPWGLAVGDVDADGDRDLWVGDRAQYIYLYRNDGLGAFTLKGGNTRFPTIPAVYLAWNSAPIVGFTPSLATSDFNGDGKADVAMSFFSGTQTPATNTPNDGEVRLGLSDGTGHTLGGRVADLGSVARGLNAADLNADGATDLVAGEYDTVKALRQLPPLDNDGDGISDYADNAPAHANAPRIDMTGDGALNAADQLDADGDTVLVDNPEDQSTWQRLGDPADTDDDNDTVVDSSDNCVFGANADQADKDADGVGNVCDPLFNSDADGDGVPTFDQADPLYDAAKAAKILWASEPTKFVLRNDALGRFFQSEFTQLLTDSATLTPEQWASKCAENYKPNDIPTDTTYEPCGTDPSAATLAGGADLKMTTVVIPKHLWTDPSVITWLNDRIKLPNLEIGQHGTFHDGLAPQGDWVGLNDGREVFSCETCGLTLAENYEKLKLGFDVLHGDYSSRQAQAHGAAATSPKVNWTDAAQPLITYAAPYNTSDDKARKAMAQYGIRSFTASDEEERPTVGYGEFFATPGAGDQMEKFDSYGLFHASADTQIDPIETPDGTYDETDKAELLASLKGHTQEGGLNTWLIEEVEWSDRADSYAPRNADTRLGPINRENNKVNPVRWAQWMDVLTYIKANGVTMTLGEVALAKAFDNAPTVANADQSDRDLDGIGDAAEDVTLTAADVNLPRGQSRNLSATLTATDGEPLAGRDITFTFDADNNGAAEVLTGVTDSTGLAQVAVTATRAVGSTTFGASWTDGADLQRTATGKVSITDATTLTLDPTNPTTGTVTDSSTFGATLVDTSNAPVAGQSVTIAVGGVSGIGTTDPNGHVSIPLTLAGPVAATTVTATYTGVAPYGGDTDSGSIQVLQENTALTLTSGPGTAKNSKALIAQLLEVDSPVGPAVAGATVRFTTEDRIKGKATTVLVGTAVTGTDGIARLNIPGTMLSGTPRTFTAESITSATYLGSKASTAVAR